MSCDKGEQKDVLVIIDDVLNYDDTGLHVPEDLLSGTGSAHTDIPVNAVALHSAHDEIFATESEPFDGDASSHVVVADHMNEVNMLSPY